MKEEMQKTTQVGYLRIDRTESESYEGAQTFMEIIGENLVEVQPSTTNLLEQLLSSDNLNEAYRQVVGNGGAGGVDKMGTSELLPYLNLHKDELIEQLQRVSTGPIRSVVSISPRTTARHVNSVSLRLLTGSSNRL